MKAILATVLAVIAITATASAKPKVDFSEFEGTYKGTYTLSAGPSVFSTAATFKVAVSKSGKKLTLIPSGLLFAMGVTYPLGGSVTLGTGKKVLLNSALFIPSVFPTFGTGNFSGRKNRFSFTTSSSFGGTTLPTTGTLTFTKKGLVFSSVTNLSGIVVYNVTLTGKKKK